MGGRNCLKYLKKGQSRKEGRENKNLKKKGGGKLGQGVDALKRRGGGLVTELGTMFISALPNLPIL